MAKNSRIGCNDNTPTFQKGFHLCRYIRGIYRRSENYAVRICHTAEYLCKSIIRKYTVASAITSKASATRLYFIFSQLYQLSFDTLLIEFIKDIADNQGCVSVFAGTSVNSDYLHGL